MMNRKLSKNNCLVRLDRRCGRQHEVGFSDRFYFAAENPVLLGQSSASKPSRPSPEHSAVFKQVGYITVINKAKRAIPPIIISILIGRKYKKDSLQFLHLRYLLPATIRIHHRRLSLQNSVSRQFGHIVFCTKIDIDEDKPA
jgi:hypothetical protein